jgi:hypothetical protein
MLASSRRRARRCLCAVGLALTLAHPLPIAASVVVPATLDELTSEADLVVHGRVVRVEPRQAPETRRVERVVSLDVLRSLKGSAAATTFVVLPGGTYGRYRTIVPGVPDLQAGEEVVLFLRTSSAGVPQLVGLSQGLLRVRIDPASGERLVLAPVAAGADGPVVRGATDRGPQPLARVEARIARTVLAQLRGRR